jgi:hypothetical protein
VEFVFERAGVLPLVLPVEVPSDILPPRADESGSAPPPDGDPGPAAPTLDG